MKRRPRKIQPDLVDDVSLQHHQRKLQYFRQRRRFHKFRMYVMTTRFFARVVVFILIVFALVKLLNLPQWYLKSDVFISYPNNSIELEGNKIVSTNQIINALKNVKLDKKPIYLLDTKIIEKSILKLPPIKNVYIRRFGIPLKLVFLESKVGILDIYLPRCIVLPPKLRIIVNEKNPIIAVSRVPGTNPTAVFTDDNTIITKQFLPLHNFKNIYSVITYDNFYKWNKNNVKSLVNLARFLESYSGQKLVYLDIRNPDDVFVQLTEYKLRIGELNQTVFKRTERIESVLTEAVKIKNQIDYIDLRWENYPSIKLKDKDKDVSLEHNEKDSNKVN